jgi:hypothetical protein
MAYLRLDSWPLAVAPQTDTIGFLAITSALLWGPTDGFTATGFRVTVAGSGSKVTGVIEKQRIAPLTLTSTYIRPISY